MPAPELPEAAHADLDSMLSRKFGKEVANYFSGSPLNRVSFLRTDQAFLSRALKHPTTSFLLFNNLAPLGRDPTKLEYISYIEVKPLIGDDPYSQTEEELIASYNSTRTIPQLLFLGLDESSKSHTKSPSKTTSPNDSNDTSTFTYNIYAGTPFFAVDVTPKGTITSAATFLISTLESRGLKFIEGRMHTSLPAPVAAIYAQSRALLDWNARNPFCAQCGQPTLSINAGTKRTCPPTDWGSLAGGSAIGSTTDAKPTERPDCATRKGISNLCFPRTDPTIIVAVLSADGERVLLGRQKRWPQYWYSTLAGFVEPAESVEEAVRREVWEESGVLLGRVVIHSTQPWPYPANLMIGCVGQAVGAPPSSSFTSTSAQYTAPQTVSGNEDELKKEAGKGGEGDDRTDARGNKGTKGTPEEIMLKHDPELEDAKWVSLKEVREALAFGTSNLGEDMPEGYKEGALRLPPRTAIANQLLEAVVNGGWNGMGGVKI